MVMAQFRLILKLYPLSLVLFESSSVEVTVKVWLVPWSELSVVDTVTLRPVTVIQGKLSRVGLKDKVSV